MKNKNILILVTFGLLMVAASCKQRKEIQKAKADEKQISTSASFSLIDSVKQHSFGFHTLSAKIKTEFKSNDGNEISVVVTMRCVNDSAIWMSVSPALGIEAARVLFTTDSIKIMDKINGAYAIESYSYLKRFTETEVTYSMLQNILMGNAAYLNNELITDSITRYYWAHSNQKDLKQELEISKLFRILGNILTDKKTSDTIKVNYADYQFVETEYFPFDIKIEASSNGKNASILLNYSTVMVNAPVEIKFHIPSSYTKMKY